jgi:translation initiation factor RLI1
MVKQYEEGGFKLEIMAGQFKTSQITVLLGENGTGKTTFIEMLVQAGKKKKAKEG